MEATEAGGQEIGEEGGRLGRHKPGQGFTGKVTNGKQCCGGDRGQGQLVCEANPLREVEGQLGSEGAEPTRSSISDELMLHYTDICNYLQRLAPAAATEDLVQETYMQAYKTIREYGPPAFHARPWLFRVARNTACTYFRRLKVHSIERLEDTPDLATPGPLEGILSSESTALLLQAISELTEAEQALIQDRYWEGRTCLEVARTLSVTPLAIRLRLHRARHHLHRRYLNLFYNAAGDQE